MMLIASFSQYIQGATNAKLDLTGTGATVLYTAPTNVSFSIVNSILVSEDSGNADTLTLTLTNGSDVFSLFKVAAVGANGTVELLTRDLVLQPTEVFTVCFRKGSLVVSDIEKLMKKAYSQKKKLKKQEEKIEDQTRKIRDQLNKINLDGKLEYFK